MNFDETTRSRLLAMSDDELKALIGAICEAAGADKNKAAILQCNVGGVRNAFSNMSAADAEKLLQSVGKDRADEIARILRGI